MKNIFTAILFLLAVTAFAQDSLTTVKTDTTSFDYGMRIYDTRIGRSASVDPKASQQNNPYQFEQQKTVSDSLTGEFTFEFNNQQYDAIIINPKMQQIKMHWLSPNNTPYKSLSSVKEDLEKQENKVLMLTNGGMYLENNQPQGLFISKGKELNSLDTDSNKYGNFYMKPNGVFYIDNKGGNITTTNIFKRIYNKENNSISFATQSGPMLVINGNIHQKFMPQSKNLHLRSGVGIMSNGNVVFIISRSNKTNFHDFGSIFKDVFDCQNALYLDGAISKMYLPKLRPNDLGGNFGVIISITE